MEPIPTSAQDILSYQITQRLASSITIPEVRDFLKKEVNQQFDGDYDALLMKIKDKRLNYNKNGRTKSKTFGEIIGLNDIARKNQRKQAISIDIESTSPLLQITIPDACQPIFYNPPTGGSGNNENCDRDRKNGKDQLLKMKFRNLTAFRNAREGWFDNKMEIRCYIFLSDDGGNSSSLVKPLTRRETDFKDCGIFSGCKAKWVNMSTEVVTWDKADYGNRMKYMWMEYDGSGSTISTEISFNTKFVDEDTKRETSVGAKTTLNFKSDDYLLGDAMVEYCDNTDGDGYMYSTPDIYFYVNQK